ncbi:heparan-alpha-glucosaminide N-acetyltransferase domain-containing protein [Microbacterium sulfonylureivorans]|uniref:heparan-alpha-glucosaminide N-acetyltransferase domain-containing protein n=1 Tax=Microbacterium sulfonylureivorans TaxID=2486854 RepID=UPI000FDAF2D6|nr:heparan-alpha-glucosaminide N-acetyltransferase domain-containing protein [Microbacterium sulfonylureivorans]
MSERDGTRQPASAPEGWIRSRWTRLNGPRRIAGVDLARGLAVIGMFAAHLLWIDEPFDWGDASTWVAVVEGRSSILFATLAGVSIGLATGGRTPPVGDALTTARLRLLVRAILLWVIGVLLILTGVPVYVILPAYALLFFLAVPLVPLGARILLPLAGVLAVVLPVIQVALDDLPMWRTASGNALSLAIGYHYPFTTWIVFVVAGLGVARAGILRLRVQLSMLAAGTALALVGYGLEAATGVAEENERASYVGALWTARPHSTGLLEVIGSGGFALAVIAACLLVCRTVVVWPVLPLRAVGAMPLTAYVGQIVVWALIATEVLGAPGDLAAFRDLEPFWPLALVTIAVCTAWALLVGRGPLEWVVDTSSKLVTAGRARPASPGPVD